VLLRSIQLLNFKNYSNQTITPATGFTCFVGLNGMGKTNLLDAIYYICTTKSKFSVLDKQIMRQNSNFFRIEASFEKNYENFKIVAKFKSPGKKIFEKDDLPYRKLAEHIGQFPVVFIAPDDTQLVQGGSEERRRLLDQTISQLDKQYLEHLLVYEKVLKQRNSVLKRTDIHDSEKIKLIGIYDTQMDKPAIYLHKKRSEFTGQLWETFQKIYKVLSNQQESPVIKYESPLYHMDFLKLMEINRKKDLILQRSSSGIHRDDLIFSLKEQPIKKFGSQGQLKTFIIALKLAQYEVMRTVQKEKPLLLLDDIFDKLDHTRVTNLISFLGDQNIGQVLITDTDINRVDSVLKFTTQESFKYRIAEGKAEQL
jgi:DNA replication and repair protein RecF